MVLSSDWALLDGEGKITLAMALENDLYENLYMGYTGSLESIVSHFEQRKKRRFLHTK